MGGTARPVEWFGRGLSNDDAKEVEAVFAANDAPGPGHDRTNLWAGTLLGYGSDTLKGRFLRPLLMVRSPCACSTANREPARLAGLRTTAVRDGDEYVVNGQKVWTSGARDADYGMLIARTDWDVPKHRGITFFWFPMKQEGVEVRPLRQMTGDARFNEVFMNDARVSADNIVGGLNNGWGVLQAALAYERAVMGRPGAGCIEQSSVGASRHRPPRRWARSRRRISRSLRWRRTSARTPIRSCGNAWPDVDAQGHRVERRSAKAELKMGGSSPLFSLGKLAMSGLLHEAGRVQGWLRRSRGCTRRGSTRACDANYSQLNAYFTSIGGGTDQIQRNIIGERILGLPRGTRTRS
ncbi:MAG: acyl-CoA dehydrogenase family protein [Acidimicrobiales bacterium]